MNVTVRPAETMLPGMTIPTQNPEIFFLIIRRIPISMMDRKSRTIPALPGLMMTGNVRTKSAKLRPRHRRAGAQIILPRRATPGTKKRLTFFPKPLRRQARATRPTNPRRRRKVIVQFSSTHRPPPPQSPARPEPPEETQDE